MFQDFKDGTTCQSQIGCKGTIFFWNTQEKCAQRHIFLNTTPERAISYVEYYFLLLNLRLAALVGSLLAMISWHASTVKVAASTPRGSL